MTTDLRTELNDCDNNTGFTGDGTSPALNTTVGQRYEGTGSIETQHTDADEQLNTVQTSGGGGTFSLDLSASTLYLLVKDNLVDSAANGGAQFVVSDGTDLIGYDVGGNDAVGLPVAPYYNGYKLDMSNRPAGFNAYTGVEANLTDTAITAMGYGSLHLAKAVGNVNNVFLDRMSHITNGSPVLRINAGTVGTPETMVDVQGDDVINGWGVINNPLGSQYGFFAPVQWGEPVASADAYFAGTDEQWFWIGDNAGGHAIGVGNFDFALAGNATDTISFELTRVVIVNTGARAAFDLSDANVNIMNLTAVTFDGLGVITFPANSATKDMADLIFNNCDQAYFDTVDVAGATFNGSNDALGAILWDANDGAANQNDVILNSGGTGHGVHINLVGNGPGAGGAWTFNISGWEVTGYETVSDGSTGNTVFLVDNDNDNDVTINVTGGVGTFSYERAAGYIGTVTIVATVAVTVGGMTQGAAVVLQARQTVGAVTDGDTIFSGFAQANGGISYSHNNEGDLDINVRANNPGHTVAAIAASGGGVTFVDETAESTDDTINDMNLLPVTPAVSDAFYFSHTEQFFGLKLWITDGNGTGSTITWEYWDGAAWSSLTGVIDGTSNFESTGHGLIVTWADPGDWATTTVTNQANTGQLYYVRARLTTVGSANQTRARRVTIDATRYLAWPQEGNAIRTITGSGLAVTAVWLEDNTGQFNPA